ncbi:hypothetical protein RF11_06868 [Thelohanellus kitauei]|uniref:Uncharacterized protein n=1 Tax=Thelohanellus kitauei TaxID=669202 RepID=A0A0C2MKU9_THEKT|nr:hypothetical protein RF11_06868 [Thelohanellus kitauei]
MYALSETLTALSENAPGLVPQHDRIVNDWKSLSYNSRNLLMLQKCAPCQTWTFLDFIKICNYFLNIFVLYDMKPCRETIKYGLESFIPCHMQTCLYSFQWFHVMFSSEIDEPKGYESEPHFLAILKPSRIHRIVYIYNKDSASSVYELR